MTTASSQGTHPTRAPSASEQKLIDDVLKLYQLQPSEQAYSHYSEDAVFRKYHLEKPLHSYYPHPAIKTLLESTKNPTLCYWKLCLFSLPLLSSQKGQNTDYGLPSCLDDPVSIAKGLDSIKSQFNGMPKLFAESTTEICDLLASSTSSRIELNLTQKYVFKSPIPFKEKGTVKPVNSKVTFHLNGSGLIEKHDEE